MRSSRRHPLFVPALLCALVVLVAQPTVAEGDGADPGISTQVARLYEDASVATQQYEAGRRDAEAQRGRAERTEWLLTRERQEIAVLHQDLGRIARAQYRQGGGLPYTAQILFAQDPDDLMRGQRAVWRADLAVANAVAKSRRAEDRLAADEAKAQAEWQALERRNGELAEIKRTIDAKLDEARSVLQSRADASVAAGACRGAVRLDQPPLDSTRAWVAPVETYELSAGFGSGGERWAHRHTGQDFAVPIGTPVRAVGAGRVVKVSCGGAFGIEVVVEHPGGYYTQYAHLAAVTVDQGQRVSTGQWIGQSGTSGNSTGPHLHFEVRVTPELGSAIDPVPWLAEHGVDV
ncbi:MULTISPECIES: M23 family metallopeptidase [unclassified Streptomyces]|uniref:M23 family metallopeptidase n=1 Tax=unclassified Streptomyces TaxID=2593676 RepID=UPI002250EE92|nr:MULTISPECIES: M23 family metallopeptidase [unclassified Streptomyces]MCX4989812.1 peptidoglycan DD-metalloendopeptidase family protein [Streptomyces sp. NBC_00568]MCX5004948.1 peptidoglycan DD-metalloendopeptidase family protein [Streptomyces sp. NBC_00638]